MKNQFKTILILSSLIILSACGNSQNKQSAEINTADEEKMEKKETADVADASFTDEMTSKVFQNYLQVKMTLVNTDFEGAKTASKNLAEAFTDERAELKALATKISESENIEEQRKHFSALTNAVTPLIEENLASGTIYKKFCPMALNGGAYWLSDIEAINNPYFGDKMLRCGKVEEKMTK